MALAFISKRIEVPKGTGRRQIFDSVPFQNKVRVADVAVRGFTLDYVDSDHHINVVEVSTHLGVIEGEIVHFRVNCQYADRNFDDQFFGTVDVLVIADLQPA